MSDKGGTHTIMKKSLAKALIDAGMTHFDYGGIAGNMTAQSGFEAGGPPITKQNFGQQIGQNQWQQQQTYGNQNNLANQLLAQSQGQGPNPAQAQFAQNTANNVATQGAQQAGQRGASSNVGLMARQVGQQGAATQQQAAGQAATLQAQQQLTAQQQEAGVLNNMANQSLQGESIEQGGQAAQNSAITTGSLGSQQINAQTSGQNAQNVNATQGGFLSSIGSVLGLAKGGVVPKKYADGGIADYSSTNTPMPQYGQTSQAPAQSKPDGLASKLADGGIAGYATPSNPNINVGINHSASAAPALSGGPLKRLFGGTGEHAPDQTDEGAEEGYLDADASLGTGSEVSAGATGGAEAGGATAGGEGAGAAALLASKGGKISFSKTLLNGGGVPGKAQYSGDTKKNDTVPTLLSPGEEVIPRSITMSKDAPAKAAEFVRHLQAKQGKGGYGDVVSAKKTLKERVEHLEKCMGGRVS